jgi:hypothetical protein
VSAFDEPGGFDEVLGGLAERDPLSISLMRLTDTSHSSASAVLVSPACSRAYVTAAGSWSSGDFGGLRSFFAVAFMR